MGGNTSVTNNYHILESTQLEGGQFKNAYIKILINDQQNTTAQNLDNLFVNKYKFPQQKIQTFQKLKFVKAGSIQQLEFVLEESLFSGRFIQVQTKRIQNNKINLKLQIYQVKVVYTIPYAIQNYRTTQIHTGNGSDKYVLKVPGRGLTQKQQQVFVEKVKLMLQKMKIVEGKQLTLMDMLVDKHFQMERIFYYPSQWHFALAYLKGDDNFHAFLAAQGWTSFINIFSFNYQPMYLQNSVIAHKYFLNKLQQALEKRISEILVSTKYQSVFAKALASKNVKSLLQIKGEMSNDAKIVLLLKTKRLNSYLQHLSLVKTYPINFENPLAKIIPDYFSAFAEKATSDLMIDLIKEYQSRK